jgi:hypothetical protein
MLCGGEEGKRKGVLYCGVSEGSPVPYSSASTRCLAYTSTTYHYGFAYLSPEQLVHLVNGPQRTAITVTVPACGIIVTSSVQPCRRLRHQALVCRPAKRSWKHSTTWSGQAISMKSPHRDQRHQRRARATATGSVRRMVRKPTALISSGTQVKQQQQYHLTYLEVRRVELLGRCPIR